MPDHRLHGTERAPRRAGGVSPLICGNSGLTPAARLVHLGEGRDLGRVADAGAGAVRFHQFDRVRRHVREAIGVQYRLFLAFRARGIDRVTLAVAGRTDSLEYRVDGVAVALGIGQTLEYDDADAFAENGAVAVGIEGLRVAAGREGRGLAEAHEHEDVVEGVDAAGNDDIGPAGLEFK